MKEETTPERLLAQFEPQKSWPIHEWAPTQEMDIGLSIDRSGRWFYKGSEITRERMLKFFASLLVLEKDQYFLITPQIRYPIFVEEYPLMAIDIESQGQGEERRIYLLTNMDDIVLVNRDNPLRFEQNPATGQVLPTVQVRDNLKAKLTRSVYYQLVDLAVETPRDFPDDGSDFHVWSDGERFCMT
ncbi:MAG: DUF1285 domain-containing protein [Gammaproteobacteria bacterium]|nr:DUF1285 domain-containing protein [Gammaproteobacteria bacterium]